MDSSTADRISLKWSQKEDQLLWTLKNQRKIKSWEIIASQINNSGQEQEKTGKQCRERFMNYLRFGLKKKENNTWTPQQDQLLYEKFIIYGPKWVVISSQIPHKSENVVKNRFYNAIGRIKRMIRQVQLEKKLKNKKPITIRKIMTTFRVIGLRNVQFGSNGSSIGSSNINAQSFNILANDLIKMATQKGANQVSKEEVFSVINRIHSLTSMSSRNKKKSNEYQDGGLEDKKQILSQFKERRENEFEIQSETKNIKESINDEFGSSKLQIQTQSWKERLGQLPQLSQFKKNNYHQRTLQEEICLIENREYVQHSQFPFSM